MNNLQAGFSRVNITPMMGIDLAGYYQERHADGVLDDLELNVLALECNGKKAVLVSADLLYMVNEVSEDFKALISEKTGIDEDAIMLHGTHTHTGPYLRKTSDDPLWIEYFEFVRKRVLDAVTFALADLKPAKMGWAIGNAPNIAFIRRFRMKDGGVQTNPGVNNPDIVAPIGDVDERVNVVRFDREGGDTIVMVNFGDHPDTVGGCKISCDWPGFLRRTVEQAIDGTKCIFFNGAQGDVNHVNVHPTGGFLNDTFNDFDDVSRGYGHARYMGRVVAGGVLQVYDKVKYVDVDSINYMERLIKIPSNMPAPEEMEEAYYINQMHEDGRDAELPYKGMMLTTKVAEAARKIKLEHGPEYFDMKLHGLTIGEVAFVGIPGEPFTGIGRGIKDGEGFALIMPACCTNGSQGYFPMKDAYDEGGYEAGSSVFRAGVAELMVAEGKELLKNLAK